MKKILITESDYEILSGLKSYEISSAYKKFCKKKKCHVQDPRLKNFYKNCSDDFNPMLYTIPFKCYFSFYLYLYLKSKAEKFGFELSKDHYTVSKPMEINFSAVKRLAGIPMGTLKAAFKELIKYGFLVYTQELASDKKNESKWAILVNDYYILEHDIVNERTIFNIKLT